MVTSVNNTRSGNADGTKTLLRLRQKEKNPKQRQQQRVSSARLESRPNYSVREAMNKRGVKAYEERYRISTRLIDLSWRILASNTFARPEVTCRKPDTRV